MNGLGKLSLPTAQRITLKMFVSSESNPWVQTPAPTQWTSSSQIQPQYFTTAPRCTGGSLRHLRLGHFDTVRSSGVPAFCDAYIFLEPFCNNTLTQLYCPSHALFFNEHIYTYAYVLSTRKTYIKCKGKKVPKVLSKLLRRA